MLCGRGSFMLEMVVSSIEGESSITFNHADIYRQSIQMNKNNDNVNKYIKCSNVG